MLTTHLVTARADLVALEIPWNILAAGEPMRSWDWLATWWTHYGNSDDRELHVLALYDESDDGTGTLVGIAPWYVERSGLYGNVLHPLGSGHVCTDHLSLVARPDYIASVASTVADYLTENDDAWDQLELPSIDDGDEAMTLLAGELEARDALVSCQKAGNCWAIDLPESWDAYLTSISSSHRRHLRDSYKRKLEAGRCQWHRVRNATEFEETWAILVDLHQRRRQQLGDAGCFASREFAAFHREIAGILLEKGQLRLSWIELDGAPFTAEYHFNSPATVYTYQSGMDPDRSKDAPGRLSYCVTIKAAIEEGFTRFDFLRGDEPYKAHFRGVALPTFDYQVFPNRRLARLRGQVTLAAGTLKDWVKLGVAAVRS
jgi:CelD/BcsL family acetyltransferase involved in cellulose biosynthesis